MKCVYLVVLLAALLVVPCVSKALDMDDDDLLLFLPFEDNVDDSSKQGNHGEIVGSADFVDGKLGKALEFSAAGEVKCPYIPLNEKSFTICMWIMPKFAGEDQQCVFSQMQNNATNTSMHFRVHLNGTIRMGYYSNDLDAPAAAEADEWTHVCFWHDLDADKRRVYINGEQAVEDSGKSAYLGNAGDTMIGSWGTSGQKFNGSIDEVQIWDRALNEAEILASMGDISATAVDAAGKLAATWGNLKTKYSYFS